MANPNDAIRIAILRHLYTIHQQQATAKNAGLAIDQLSEMLRTKGYEQREVASNLDYLLLKGWIREAVEHDRVWTIPGTIESVERKIYKISDSGIEQVEAKQSPWAALLTFVKSIMQPAAILILNVVAGLVFFPFKLLTSLPAALAIGASIGLGWLGFRNGRRGFLIASIVIALGGIAWATLGLFVVLRKPLYCYSSDTTNPFKAEVLRVGAGKPVGNVFYITDPVRNLAITRKIAQTLSRQITFIEKREDYGQRAMLIPLTDAVTHTVSSTGSVSSAEELHLAYYGPTVRAEASHQNKTVSIGFGVVYIAIVRYVHKAIDKPGLPWQAVIYDPAEGRKSALYVAHLDVALSAAARGDFEAAVDTLESAYEYAPSEVERARNRALLAKVSLAILDGTAGETQSLSFMNQAMQHWPPAHRNEPIKKTDLSSPVDTWLWDEFRTTFFRRQAEYPHWARVLAFHGRPVVVEKNSELTDGWTFSNWTESVADSPEQSLISADKDQLLALISRMDNTDVLQRIITERYGSSPGAWRWLVDTMISEGPVASGPVNRAIDWAIQRMPEPWYAQYSKAWHVQQVITTSVSERNSVKAMQRTRQIAEELGFAELVRVIDELSAQLLTSKEVVLRVNDTGAAPNDPWYHRSFLDWFSATVMATSARALEYCKHPSPRCQQLLEATADRVQRDHSGNGNLFAPGLAVVLTLARISHQELDPNLKVIYREATGAEILPSFGKRQ